MPQTPQVPMTADALKEWRGNLEKARQVRKTVEAWWDANVKEYAPSPNDNPATYGALLNTNRDFTLVERKKADLFYQQPDIQAIPSPLMSGQEAILDTHTAILQTLLGVDRVYVKDLVHRMLFDVLCPAGTGWGVMGYESATVPTPQLDPQTGQPVMVPVPVFEDLYWRHLSPKQILIPHTFRSTRWDDAPFLGYDFEWPLAVVKRKGWVPEDFTGQHTDDDLYFDYGLGKHADDATARGAVIFYKSALYREDIAHPQHLTMLIFIEGIQDPVEHKDCPYQTIGPDGSLTPDSLIGYPIHPLTIRSLSDSAYVPSDCTISRPLVNELNRFRGQMVEQRDANTLRWMYDTSTLPPDALAKIVRSPIGGMVGVPPEAFHGEGAIKELPHGTFPRENFSFNDYVDNDLARTHALDSNQAGVQAKGDQTATEASILQNNVNARMGLERGVVLDWYIRGVTKYSTLVQRFLSLKDATAIVGQEAAQVWDQWRHTVPAALAFTAMPDAALQNDAASERDQAMKTYTYLANDPFVNRLALMRAMLPKLHLPQSIVQQPPPPHPEPPKINLTIAAADLDPTSPSYGNIYQILTQQGIQNLAQPTMDPITSHALQTMQAATAHGHTIHGGKVAQMESLDKHQADLTGGMPGVGQIPAPMPAAPQGVQ